MVEVILKAILLIIIITCNECQSIEININNENELITNLNYNTKDSITLIINDYSLNILGNIEPNTNIKKLYIIGNSKESSVLSFENNINGFIFKNTIQEITLQKISINGNLRFNNIQKIKLQDVILNGAINFSDNCINNESIEIDNLTYNPSYNLKSNCIELYGNVKITNSSFYGSRYCVNSIIYYNGENLNNISISDSNFNGMYENNCLNINDSKSANIVSSIFEKGNANVKGGLVYN